MSPLGLGIEDGSAWAPTTHADSEAACARLARGRSLFVDQRQATHVVGLALRARQVHKGSYRGNPTPSPAARLGQAPPVEVCVIPVPPPIGFLHGAASSSRVKGR